MPPGGERRWMWPSILAPSHFLPMDFSCNHFRAMLKIEFKTEIKIITAAITTSTGIWITSMGSSTNGRYVHSCTW